MAEVTGRGLEDVVVAESDICFIDGKEGRLVYRGFDIKDLGKEATFEEIVYLLWNGELPNRSQLAELTAALQKEAGLPDDVLGFIKSAPKTGTPMEILRTAVSMLSLSDPEADVATEEANRRKALRLMAKTAAIVAAIGRTRAGKEPLAPKPGANLATNFLYTLFGEEPSAEDARVMDVCLILHADHEFNASTFSGRVTAATLSDLYSAMTSAIGTLKGPLHGGANENVMRMLLEIGSVDKAPAFVQNLLANKVKISGFGHRVYRTEDPRAWFLRQFSEEVGKRRGDTKLFDMSRVVEKTVMDEKGLFANVDFYSASTYYMLGIPLELFTPIFAVSRMSGWTAHVLEQYANNRLIRPRSRYIGPEHRDWVPIGNR